MAVLLDILHSKLFIQKLKFSFFKLDILYFVRLVWKSTTQVNFALCASSVKDSRGAYWTVVVANYFRAGNLIGSYTANVPKLI